MMTAARQSANALRLAGLMLLAIVTPMVVSKAWAQTVPDDFVITLERSCSAECAVYKVSIDAKGNIEFEGLEFTRVLGRQTAKIQPSLVADLFKTVQRIGFFELRNRYVSIPNPDGSETTVTHPLPVFVTVTANGKSKRIENKLGGPTGLAELERQIDETAGTSRWTRLDEPTLRQLVKEGWEPSAEERANLLRKAIEDDDAGVVKGLIAIGADPNGTYFEERSTPLMFVRSAAMVRVLLESGAIASTKSVSGITPLNTATLLAPGATEMLLKAGAVADDAMYSDGRTALFDAACVGNAGVVKLLLASGANPFAYVSGTSAAECASQRRERVSTRDPRLPSRQMPFAEDFDTVIALLTKATSSRTIAK